MNPTPDEPHFNDLPFRQIHCRHYGACLNYTIERNWDGFTCAECPDYEREELSQDDREALVGACLNLLSELVRE